MLIDHNIKEPVVAKRMMIMAAAMAMAKRMLTTIMATAMTIIKG